MRTKQKLVLELSADGDIGLCVVSRTEQSHNFWQGVRCSPEEAARRTGHLSVSSVRPHSTTTPTWKNSRKRVACVVDRRAPPVPTFQKGLKIELSGRRDHGGPYERPPHFRAQSSAGAEAEVRRDRKRQRICHAAKLADGYGGKLRCDSVVRRNAVDARQEERCGVLFNTHLLICTITVLKYCNFQSSQYSGDIRVPNVKECTVHVLLNALSKCKQ